MKAEFDFDAHARQRIDYIGVTFRTRTIEEVREILIKMRADLWDDVKAGRIKVPIDKTYPLAEAKAGHEHMRDQPALRQDFADPVDARARIVTRRKRRKLPVARHQEWRHHPGEDRHAVSPEFHQHHARRGRGACDARNAKRHGSVKANDRRCAGPSVEGGIRRLEMGARAQAAVARAVHHREARADDGRGRRRSRRHRAAVLAGRPQRLCARSRQALSQPLRRHGPHRAGEAGVGGAAAEVEGAARHEGHPADVPARAGRDAAARRLGFPGGREGRRADHVLRARTTCRSSARSPSAIRGCR